MDVFDFNNLVIKNSIEKDSYLSDYFGASWGWKEWDGFYGQEKYLLRKMESESFDDRFIPSFFLHFLTISATH